jgi:hypothetical protein
MGLGFRFRQGFGTRVRVVVNRAFRFPPTFGVLGLGPSPRFCLFLHCLSVQAMASVSYLSGNYRSRLGKQGGQVWSGQ